MDDQEYVHRLNAMYEDVYDKENHCCRHWTLCKSKEPVKFCFDRVKIGEKYGTTYPKILFVGLEGVRKGVADYRIPPISRDNDNSKPSLSVYNNHYKGVRYVLSYLLAKLSNEAPPASGKKRDLSQPPYTEHLKHYCLTNLYKCAFGDPQKSVGLMHTDAMKKQCPEILFSEIEILRPDMIVIQAVAGLPEHFWERLKTRFHCNGDFVISAQRNDNTSAFRLYYDDGQPFYCIRTYHGNGFPYPDRHGGVFPSNAEYIHTELNPILDAVVRQYAKQQP